MLQALYFFVPIVVCGYLINFLTLRTPLRHAYQFIVRPGVIIHEVGHYIACKLMLAEVKQVSFFDKSGGFVKHSPSPIPVLGTFIISLAPLVGGALVIILLGQKLGFAREISNVGLNVHDVLAIFNNYNNIYFWIYLYAVLAIGSTLTPSTQDLQNCFIALVIVTAVIYYFRHTIYVQHMIASLAGLMPLVVYPLILVVVMIFIVFAISKLIRIV